MPCGGHIARPTTGSGLLAEATDSGAYAPIARNSSARLFFTQSSRIRKCCNVPMKLSQNPKNAEKSAIFMVAKGQLLTKFMARYVGGHATQALSLRCHRCPMGSAQAVSPHAGSHGPPPRR